MLSERADASVPDDKCDSTCNTTYQTALSASSITMLTQLLTGLCGKMIEPGTDLRLVFTMAVWINDGGSVLRLSFVRPETVTCTAHLDAGHFFKLLEEYPNVVRENNNAKMSRPSICVRNCKVVGKITPYLVDRCGLTEEAAWSHLNAMGTRFVHILTNDCQTRYLSHARRSLEIPRVHIGEDAVMADSNLMRSFKLTRAPRAGSFDVTPKKSTCVLPIKNGNFRVQGKPSDIHAVFRSFRQPIVNVLKSDVWEAFLLSF